jgi:hypothetical protein
MFGAQASVFRAHSLYVRLGTTTSRALLRVQGYARIYKPLHSVLSVHISDLTLHVQVEEDLTL